MQGLEDLSERIKSAEELKTVVSSMQSLARLSIRQYEQSVRSLREYNRTLEQGLRILLGSRPESINPVPSPDEGRSGFLVLGSGMGMCGPFNEKILEYSLQRIRDFEPDIDSRELYTAGERITGLFENQGLTPQDTLSLPSSVEGITPVVQDLLAFIDEIRTNRDIRRFWVFHHRQSGERSYEPDHLQLLPIDRDWIDDLAVGEWSGRTVPDYRGDWRELFRHLMDQHLFVSLFRAYAESLASENAARLQAMGGAEENITRRLRELRKKYHQTRQTGITEELLDLTSGYEALNKEGRYRGGPDDAR